MYLQWTKMHEAKQVLEIPFPSGGITLGDIKFTPSSGSLKTLQQQGRLNAFNLGIDGLISFTDAPIVSNKFQMFKDLHGNEWAFICGQMINGKPNGYVTAVHKYGAICEGNYFSNKFEGFGRVIKAGGSS